MEKSNSLEYAVFTGTSQGTLCNEIVKPKVKGVGRPKKKGKKFNNPFDLKGGVNLGCRKYLGRNNRLGPCLVFGGSFVTLSGNKEVKRKEAAREIIDCAEQIGLKVLGDREKVIIGIAEQLQKGEL